MSEPRRGVLLLIAGVLNLVAFIALHERGKISGRFRRIPASHGTENTAHDQLMALSDRTRILSLATIVKNGCIGTGAFFMGMASNHSAYWSVACANGKSYVVQVAPDANGSTAVLNCAVLSRAEINCFDRPGTK